MKKITRTLLALIAFGFLLPAYALQGESIVFNPATGNYLITHYSDFDRAFEQLTFIPATKINPTLKSKLKLEQGAIVQYGYSLVSGRDSQQVIRMLILDPVSSVKTGMPDIPLNAPPGKVMDDIMNAADYFDTPVPWSASMAYSSGRMSFRIGWSYKLETGGLSPGNKAAFGFKSRDLPGIIKAEVYGYAPDSQEIDGEELPDAEDGGFGQQYFALLLNDFVRRTAAVPAIPVPTPFNAATLLERIQTQAHTWIGMQLLDAFFSSQLDRYFAAAASAYSHNQPKAGKEHIETLRKMLKSEYEDVDKDDEKEDGKPEGNKTKRSQIDPLAARVLDFNLKYVLKRMDKD